MYPGAAGPFTERLDVYERREDYMDMRWSLLPEPSNTTAGATEPFTITVFPSRGSISYERYAEQLEVRSICDGRAVKVFFPTYYCVSEEKEDEGYDLSVRTKMPLGKLTMELEAVELREGRCPRA